MPPGQFVGHRLVAASGDQTCHLVRQENMVVTARDNAKRTHEGLEVPGGRARGLFRYARAIRGETDLSRFR